MVDHKNAAARMGGGATDRALVAGLVLVFFRASGACRVMLDFEFDGSSRHVGGSHGLEKSKKL